MFVRTEIRRLWKSPEAKKKNFERLDGGHLKRGGFGLLGTVTALAAEGNT